MGWLIAAGVLGELVSLKAQWSFDYPKGNGIWRQDIRLGGGGGISARRAFPRGNRGGAGRILRREPTV